MHQNVNFLLTLSFFGQLFTAEGTTPDPARVLDAQNALVPTNVHEVRSSLGMANYSSRYIPNYATISKPLRVLTKTNARFTWTSSHQTAFDHLKKALARTPLMSYLDTTKETFITVDASHVGMLHKLAPRFNEKALIVVHRNKTRITIEDNDKRKITRNLSHFKRILIPSNLENASEADSESETKQHKDSDDDYDNNDAKRTDNVEERQRLVARRSDRLRREPDRLGVPIPSEIVR